MRIDPLELIDPPLNPPQPHQVKSCPPGPPIWWLDLGTHADTSGQLALTGGFLHLFHAPTLGCQG